jgi:outer membrane lipoprotein-sorting protein
MKKLLIIIFTFGLAFFASAQNLKPVNDTRKNEIIAGISQTSKTTYSLECKFIQKKNLSVLSETVVSEGVMYFKKDNNLRWQYNKPYSYLFILSNGKVMIKNEARVDQFDTKSNKMFKEISEIMIGGVKGDLLLDNPNFTAQYFENVNSVIIKLAPKGKEMKQLFSSINLIFNKNNWLVNSLEMIEEGGDNTVITFTEKNVNKTISDDIFRIN